MKLSDIPFEPRFSDKAMAAAKEVLLEMPSMPGTAVASFAIINDDGDTAKYYSRVCHREISNTMLVGGNSLVVTSGTGWNEKTRHSYPLPRELAKFYVEYLMNDFYAGMYILNRDVDECLDSGFVVSADAPTTIMQNLMIATRNLAEVKECGFVLFRDLCQRGVLKDLAYLCSFSTNYSSSEQVYGTNSPPKMNNPTTSYGGHRPHRLLPLDAIKLMILGEIGPGYSAGFKTYRESKAYSGGAMLFDEKGPTNPPTYTRTLLSSLLKREDFRADLSAYRKDRAASEVYRPPNPFAKPNPWVADIPKADQISLEEFVSFVIPWTDTLLKKELDYVEEVGNKIAA